MSSETVQKTLKSEMFAIIHHDGLGQPTYRASKYEDGRSVKFTTEKLSQADLFKSKESALDHAIFALSDTILVTEFLSVVPIVLEQSTTTLFRITEGEQYKVYPKV